MRIDVRGTTRAESLMTWSPLPVDAPLSAYDAQAAALLSAWQRGDPDAVRRFRERLPRFLRQDVPWLPRQMSEADIRATRLDHADARLAVARSYDFRDWPALVALVESVQDPESPVARFERAVDAVVDGDVDGLGALLRADTTLTQVRSTRRMHYDPPVHGAMLLHYVAANGVEGYRQRTPDTITDIARMLLESGADPNAVAYLYGGACTTMSLLVSSGHPARAGKQVELIDRLVDFGASVEPRGEGAWTSPLRTALTFGYLDAAQALVRRGASVTTLAEAAGLGDTAGVVDRLPQATAEDRQRGLALAAALGHVDVVSTLLDAGEDPNRHNPPQAHSHSTPLHQAVASGQLSVVQLLVERGARLDIRDTMFDGTPLGWAEYLDQGAVAAYLLGRGAGR
jgi:ankyrin repeat protein